MITNLLLNATWQTLYMSLISTFFATAIGLALAICLILTKKDGLKPNRFLYASLDILVNIVRSFPFIILIIILFPVTKLIVGTKIGTTAAIVPLSIGASAFIARLIENAFNEVDKGVIEAALSFGSNIFQIIFKVIFSEALPSIISAITLTLIVVIGFSAMAGAVGGGGLGAVAINYGSQRFRADILTYTVIILIIVIQIFQMLGNYLYEKTKK